jgi:hypothetical protein
VLSEALMALASAGGMAVVQAASTEAWEGFRARVARLFGRGDAQREQVAEEQLDQAEAALTAVSADGLQRVRAEVAKIWRGRFEALLEGLDGDALAAASGELREVVRNHGIVSADAGGLAVGGDISVHASGGSVAAGVIHGGVQLGNPPVPGPSAS